MFIEGSHNTEEQTISGSIIDFKTPAEKLTVEICARRLIKKQGYNPNFLEFIPDDLKSKIINLGFSYDIDEIIPDLIKERRSDIDQHQEAVELEEFLKELTQTIYYTEV